MLLTCRVIMGLGEGVAFPSIQNLVACNVPHSKKPRSLAIIYSGLQVRILLQALSIGAVACNVAEFDLSVFAAQFLQSCRALW